MAKKVGKKRRSAKPATTKGTKATRMVTETRSNKRVVTRRKTSKPSVFIADDDKKFRESLVKLFEDEGFKVTCSASMEDPIQSVCKGSFDVIVLDMYMPEEEGGEIKEDAGLVVAQLLKKYTDMNKSVILVVFTGYPSVKDCLATIDSGAYYLPKCTLDIHGHVLDMSGQLVKECKRLVAERSKRPRPSERPTSRLWLVDNYTELMERFSGQAIGVFDKGAEIGDLKTTSIGEHKVVSALTVEALRTMILQNPLLRKAQPLVLEIWKEEN